MKNIVRLLCGIIVLALFAGCAQSGPAPQQGKPVVYTSFYPMYDFAAKVGGDKIDLRNLVPAGTEAHEWEPSPQDIAGLEKADMLIYNGAGMEHWVEKVVESLRNEKLVVLETAHDLELLESGAHHDEDAEHEEEELHEDAGEHAEDHDHDHGDHDPHVWLSIRRAKQQMQAIERALSELDPANKDYYRINYEQYAMEFDKLDTQYEQTLAPLPRKEIVVAHSAFGYLCHDYGLEQVSARGFSPDAEPTPDAMAAVMEYCKEHDVQVIFFEVLTSPEVAQTIAKQVGARTDVLNPIEGLTKEQADAGEDYLSIMRQNLQALEGALG